LTSGSEYTGLFSVVYDQGSYYSRYPSAEGEQEDDEHGAATLVNNRQGRKDDAYYYSPD